MLALPNAVADWSDTVRVAVLAFAAVAYCGANHAMAGHARVMKDRGRTGILGFQMLGSWQRAEPVLAAWGDEGRRAARSSLWWDSLLFIPAYAALLGTLSGLVADHATSRGWPGWANVATVASYTVVAAALCDLLENIALCGVLRNSQKLNFPKVARTFASIKWLIVVVAVLVMLTVALLFVAAPGSIPPGP